MGNQLVETSRVSKAPLRPRYCPYEYGDRREPVRDLNLYVIRTGSVARAWTTAGALVVAAMSRPRPSPWSATCSFALMHERHDESSFA